MSDGDGWRCGCPRDASGTQWPARLSERALQTRRGSATMIRRISNFEGPRRAG